MLVDSNVLWVLRSLERACSLELCTSHSCAMLQATMIRMHAYNRQWGLLKYELLPNERRVATFIIVYISLLPAGRHLP